MSTIFLVEKKGKLSLKIARVKSSPHAWVPRLKSKEETLKQLEKPDADFNQHITKVEHTVDTISNVMRLCVDILGDLAQVPQNYSQFQPNFIQHDPFLRL